MIVEFLGIVIDGIVINVIFCESMLDGVIDVIISGGIGDYIFLWFIGVID